MRLTLLVWLTVAFAAASYAADRQVGVLAPGKFFWEPELAPSGPLVMIPANSQRVSQWDSHRLLEHQQWRKRT